MRLTVLLSLIVLHGCSTAKQPATTAAPTGAELPGKFVWHDLLTSDPAAAQRFYAELFGWEFRPGNSEYTVVTQAGRPIGGILDTRKAKTKVPAQWLGSLSVADVDSAVGLIRAGGGKVHWGPKSMPRGRVALVADSQSVPFVVMRAPQGDPPNESPDVNGWLWDELWTRDPQAATRFYGKLASYRVTSKDTPYRVYYVLESGGQPRAGVAQLLAAEVKPTWLSYVRVADVNTTVGRVESLGGRVLIAPSPKIRDGRVALIQDPTGAAIAIQEWEPKS
jgi:predicted enzyme related to lactoylglutathione lyase